MITQTRIGSQFAEGAFGAVVVALIQDQQLEVGIGLFENRFRSGKIYYGSLRILAYFFAQIAWRGIRFKRPLGVAFPTGWAHGFRDGMRQPLDKPTRCFRPTGTEEILRYGGNISKVVLRAQQADNEAEEVQRTGVP